MLFFAFFDHILARSLSLFGDDKISEDIETDIPDKLKKLHEHMKSLYTKGYLDCMRNATIGMSMDNE